MNIRKMPIGVQDFEKLITSDYVYVDKTAFVYRLVQGNCYFLSRPRRFGKSLFLSTLKQYFLGNKDVFRGLAIEKLEEENPTSFDHVAWAEHPVIYIDLNSQKYDTKESLIDILSSTLAHYEAEFNITELADFVSLRFANLVRAAYKATGRKTVVLVDEYDKPLLQVMDNPELFNDYRTTLKAFYGVLKSEDASLRFSMLTGVTKFSQVSVWSDLNNLEDISLDESFACVCGITEAELKKCFPIEIESLAIAKNLSKEECFTALKKMYDGYHFSRNAIEVYNPFSVLNTLKKREFNDYWFATGTPTFLVEEIKRNNFDLRSLIDGVVIAANALDAYAVGSNNPVPILFQSGYLTIKSYETEYGLFHLSLPNEEVKYGFLNFLSPDFLGVDTLKTAFDIRSFNEDMKVGNVEAFMTRLQSIVASLPYPVDTKGRELELLEYNFQVAVYLVFTLMGQFTQCEVHSAKGRADSIVNTRDVVYIFEFKTNDTVGNALQQVNASGYADQYKASGKSIVKIGAVFSTTERKLTDWRVE